ncbi:GyrI-like domain-containing protein [Nocardia sp. NBC_01329]|uniref:GyrI-like domain-containing protein n=1 Tax=Nocardia sp. NBC_01329 TaxID=2903594 RepID=UPI002E14A39B|nr:GyrI-like domain-containing protein [Nocardia sp. NBC_01329]
MRYQVSVDESGPHTVLAIRRRVRTDRAGDDIGNGMAELYELARTLRLVPVGPPRTTYHGDFRRGGTTGVEFELPVTGPAGDSDLGFTIHRSEQQSFAHTCHHGDYAGIAAAYQAIDRWIQDSGRHATGPPTEIYHVAPDEIVAPAELLTEIRVPVTPVVLAVRVHGPFATIVDTTREILRYQGFEVIGELDVAKAMAGRSRNEFGSCSIIDAYHPGLALRMMEAVGAIAPLLPCSISLRADGALTVVETTDPDLLLKRGDLGALEPTGREMRQRLETLLRTLADKCAADDEVPGATARATTQAPGRAQVRGDR